MASVGHIMEIPKKGLNIDIKNGFTPTYEVMKDKKDVVKGIKEAAKKSSIIYLATDPDREGENISFCLYNILDKESQKKCKRVTFNEITKKAVLNAIENARDLDYHLIDAQKARQVLDRLIGYKVSPLLWRSSIPKSSAGRCQSIALKLICDKQREIDAFKPEDFWFIETLLRNNNGEFWAKVVTKEKDNKYLDEKLATKDLEALKNAKYKIATIERKEVKNNPYPPFDTNSLQVSCSNIFGWSLSKSKTIAQSLYTAGLVSYIRTDSFDISEDALKKVRDFIKDNEKPEYLSSKPNIYTKKASSAAQEAHESIHPTSIENDGSTITDSDEQKMYKLIRDRFLACQMSQQVIDSVIFNIKTDTKHNLIAKGQTIKFDGWSKVYKYSKTKEEILPKASEGEELELKDINKTKHTTKPPARYNEGSLSKKMEEENVGRPSTRDSIITSIQKKEYVEKDKKSKGLIATYLGLKICDYLQPNFKDFFMDVKYTSSLENDLDEIADGKKTYLEVVSSVYEILQKHIKDSENNNNTKPKELVKMGTKCTVCKEGDIVERNGKYGKFYACSAYPSCKAAYNMNEDGTFTLKEKKEIKKSGKKCPECKKNGRDGELIERKNKSNGNSFYGCEKYPTCRYAEPIDGVKSFTKSPKKEEKEESDELNLSFGEEENNNE
jgi:DNA topoisomerase-1